ncbi:MAG: enoyl-ACP reductase [Gammaproteobacteria bacterium]|jgi:enoyl-[acyl-carrier protein] reductase I|nr:enoyl-[acyl-carrier-protein] reductase FabI [Chromatiales bacterium]MDP6674723.1 enoyl-ACP reductase [Gammaproteobacteria bacterium]
MGFLEGKKALITGIASDRSIAWGAAQVMAREGCELAFTYQGDKIKDRVIGFAKQVGNSLCMPMDVTSDEQIDAVFRTLNKEWDDLDVILHSIGFAPRDQMSGNYLETINREGSHIAHDISSYSFPALAKAGRSMLKANSSLVTLSYLGAARAIPNYNVMGPAKASLEANVRFMAADLGKHGIRVNGISAGPIKTLAAVGIGGFRGMMSQFEKVAPLRRAVTTEEVGNVVAFLSSDLASGITGEIVYVDAGYNILGFGIN